MKLLATMLVCSLCSIAVAQTTKPVEKPKQIVTREEWGSEPQEIPDSRKHTPKFITIHHAGVFYKKGTDPAKFVKNMQGWGQREKKWPDLAYHFLIAPDGKIYEGRKLEYEPESNTKYELQGHIGVELMGSFGQQRMNQAQLDSLVQLVAYLCQELNVDPKQIGGHKDRAQTECPGPDMYRYIKDKQIEKWVTAMMAGQQPEVKLLPPLPKGPTTMIGEEEEK